jgi:protocatechuate 3,4-dioxygenase beta subunit
MKSSIFVIIFTALITSSGCTQNGSQNQGSSTKNNVKVGGRCEGCEAIYESPVSFDKLSNIDTLPDFNEPGPKIEISGIVYQRDGKTPAKDVIIYVYHTDQTGKYTSKADARGWGKRHGYIRGWMKTDRNGYYQFYTLRPAHYPEGNVIEHIHVTVKEPDKNEYWISSYLFDDDPLLTPEKRRLEDKRGGDGIVKLIPQENGISHGTRHILLGVNVPDYPVNR